MMLPDEQPVEYILESIDAEMATQPQTQPKVILFDIGGVVVSMPSPEVKDGSNQRIPVYRTIPHCLPPETVLIRIAPMLTPPDFYGFDKFFLVLTNKSQVVSPFQSILDYELNLGIPAGWINYSISKTAPDGFWQRLETGLIPLNHAFFEGFSRDLSNPELWATFYSAQRAKNPKLTENLPPVPKIDAEWLFNEMMSAAVHPDPWMFPALKNLKSSGKYILAALSNTVIFPPGHKLHRPDLAADPVRSIFDCFVSSAHVGLRKPDPRIYRLALREADRFARQNAESPRGRELGWADGIGPGDILFLDDIGQNLKAGREAGFRTIKVHLGRAFEAVEELERVTGLKLAGDHPKIPIKPRSKTVGQAKI